MSREEWVATFVAVVGALIIVVTAIDRRIAPPSIGLALMVDDPTEDERALTPGEEQQIADLRDGLADGGQFEEPTPTMREELILVGGWCACGGPTEPGQAECDRCWDAAEQEYARRVDR